MLGALGRDATDGLTYLAPTGTMQSSSICRPLREAFSGTA
jgi:hypothetical protein